MNRNDNENQEWWIKLEEVSEGPFSAMQLRRDPRITPDTLVWKKGFAKWVPIRDVEELADLFKDNEEETDSDLKKANVSQKNDELVIAAQKDPYDFFYWLILAVVIICYILYQLYWI